MNLLLAMILMMCCAPDFHNVSGSANTGQEDLQHKLTLVHRIYVGDMGRGNEAARFRLLLRDELTEMGFSVVNEPEDADAILKGALSVRVHNGSAARVYVALETLNGDRLWAKDFGNGIIKNLFTLKEPVKLRAKDVARALRNACKTPAARK